MRTKKQIKSDAAVLLKAARIVVNYIQDDDDGVPMHKHSCTAIGLAADDFFQKNYLQEKYNAVMSSKPYGLVPSDFEGKNRRRWLHERPLEDIVRIQNHRALALLFFREMVLSGDA